MIRVIEPAVTSVGRLARRRRALSAYLDPLENKGEGERGKRGTRWMPTDLWAREIR